MQFNEMSQTELGNALEKLYQSLRDPFPYADCRKVEAKLGVVFDDFIPDFDLYSSSVCGCASSTKRFFTMPEEEARNFQRYVERPFFEVHPQYQMAEAFINAENTPALYAYMHQTEQMRLGMRLLLQRRLAGEE